MSGPADHCTDYESDDGRYREEQLPRRFVVPGRIVVAERRGEDPRRHRAGVGPLVRGGAMKRVSPIRVTRVSRRGPVDAFPLLRGGGNGEVACKRDSVSGPVARVAR